MVTLANGSQTIAKGISSACPLPSLPLTSVLYVPDSPGNLISISKLTCDLKCLVTFSNNSVTLQDRSTGRTMDIGHESQSLFHLSSPSCSADCTCTNSPLLNHNLLGHPSFASWFPIFIVYRHLCPVLKTFRSSDKVIFELVHIDFWGPSRSKSTLGFQYFVTFIDGYFRCT